MTYYQLIDGGGKVHAEFSDREVAEALKRVFAFDGVEVAIKEVRDGLR